MYRKTSSHPLNLSLTQNTNTYQSKYIATHSNKLFNSYMNDNLSLSFDRQSNKKQNQSKNKSNVYNQRIYKNHTRASSDFNRKQPLQDISCVAWNTKMILGQKQRKQSSQNMQIYDRTSTELNKVVRQLENKIKTIQRKLNKNQQLVNQSNLINISLRQKIDQHIKKLSNHNNERIYDLQNKIIKMKQQIHSQINYSVSNKKLYLQSNSISENLATMQESFKKHIKQYVTKQIDDIKSTLYKSQQKIDLFKSGRKFSGTQITFVYEEYIKKIQAQKESFSIKYNIKHKQGSQVECDLNKNIKLQKINEKIYHIDNQGYLLDKQMNYLIDKTAQPIKLPQKYIEILKQIGILKNQSKQLGNNQYDTIIQ